MDIYKMEITKGEARESIQNFEEIIQSMENHFEGDSCNAPLEHHFAYGTYLREMLLPKGTVITGKIHNFDHLNFLMKGTVYVVSEDGNYKLKAPQIIRSSQGVKRVMYAETDVIWVNVHPNPNNTKNLNELEDFLVSKTYEDYHRKKLGIFGRIKNWLTEKILL